MNPEMSMLWSVLAVALGYLVGSISFAVIVSRLWGLADPRTYGSKNPGATNVLRSGSKSAAAAALLLDMLKGLVPVLLVRLYGEPWGLGEGTAAWVGVAAFLGHLYPVFFGLKGGKGVATAAGVLFALNPWLGLATLATWLIIAFFFRYSSLAAVVSAVFAPFYNVLLFGLSPTALPVILIGLLLIYRHEGNIRKLIAGQEARIGQKAGQAASAGPAHQGGHGGRKHGAGKGGR